MFAPSAYSGARFSILSFLIWIYIPLCICLESTGYCIITLPEDSFLYFSKGATITTC